MESLTNKQQLDQIFHFDIILLTARHFLKDVDAYKEHLIIFLF
jgi:hypothetical protein